MVPMVRVFWPRITPLGCTDNGFLTKELPEEPGTLHLGANP